jgi:hypothetical protein
MTETIITITLIVISLLVISLIYSVIKRGSHYIFNGYINLNDLERALNVLAESNNGAVLKVISSSTIYPLFVRKVVEGDIWFIQLEINKQDYEKIVRKNELGGVIWKKINVEGEIPKYMIEKLKINMGHNIEVISTKLISLYKNDFLEKSKNGIYVRFLNTKSLVTMDEN